MAFNIPNLLTSKEVAGILGVTAEHLANDRHNARQAGTPPLIPYIRLGKRLVRYHPDDVTTYLECHRVGV